jgi:hypothetical protein
VGRGRRVRWSVFQFCSNFIWNLRVSTPRRRPCEAACGRAAVALGGIARAKSVPLRALAAVAYAEGRLRAQRVRAPLQQDRPAVRPGTSPAKTSPSYSTASSKANETPRSHSPPDLGRDDRPRASEARRGSLRPMPLAVARSLPAPTASQSRAPTARRPSTTRSAAAGTR